MLVHTYAPYDVLHVSGHWYREDDDARFRDSLVWNLASVRPPPRLLISRCWLVVISLQISNLTVLMALY